MTCPNYLCLPLFILSVCVVHGNRRVKSHFCVSLRNRGRGRGWLEAVQFVGARILYLFVLKNESITSL